MALEYIALKECPVNREMEIEDFLMNHQKVRHTEALYRTLRGVGKSHEEIMNMESGIIQVNGPTKKMTESKAERFGDMVDQIKPFVALGRQHCAGCPMQEAANTGAFGCYGAVNYSITARGEEWLMQRWADHAAAGESEIGNLIVNNKITGKNLKNGRPANGLFKKKQGGLLEREKPVTVKVGSEGRSINSDQVIELLLAIGQWQRRTVLHFLKEFGAVDGFMAEEAETALAVEMMLGMTGGKLDDAKEPAQVMGPFLMAVADEADHDPSVAQFKRFFHVMYLAFREKAQFMTNG